MARRATGRARRRSARSHCRPTPCSFASCTVPVRCRYEACDLRCTQRRAACRTLVIGNREYTHRHSRKISTVFRRPHRESAMSVASVPDRPSTSCADRRIDSPPAMRLRSRESAACQRAGSPARRPARPRGDDAPAKDSGRRRRSPAPPGRGQPERSPASRHRGAKLRMLTCGEKSRLPTPRGEG